MKLTKDSSAHIISIQGLRGLAVATVVLYHAGLLFNGGFIGVDIFFVISGYVIGASLLRELRLSGTISWLNFYLRRAKRLVPALVTTLVGTILLYLLIDGVRGANSLSRSLISGVFFVSNFYFFFERGYVALDTNPLRNLWSLSVEEQFYLALPILFIFAGIRRSGQQLFVRLLFWVLITLTISFLGNVILVHYSNQFGIPSFLLPERFAFFSPFTRAWEFLLGLLIALNQDAKFIKVRLKHLSAPSLIILIFSALWLDSWQPFPGWFSVPPAIATAILIVNAECQITVTRLLSNRILVFLGDISYGLYLIHWPLIVILRERFGDKPWISIAIIFLSVVLSVLMLRYIEEPVRRRSSSSVTRTSMAITTLAFIPVLLLAAIGHISEKSGAVDGHSPNSKSGFLSRENTVRSGSTVCHDLDWRDLSEDATECVEEYSLGAPIVILVGDSHAYSISEGIVAAAKRNGFSVLTWSRSGCPFLTTDSINRTCHDSRDYMLQVINRQVPSAVFIVNGFNHYLEGLRDERSVPRGLKTRVKEIAQDYGKTIEYILSLGVKPILVYEVPNLAKTQRPLNELQLRKVVTSSIDSEVKPFEAMYQSEVIRVDPADALCASGICYLTDTQDLVLYRDAQHLNADGALFVSPLFDSVFEELKKSR